MSNHAADIAEGLLGPGTCSCSAYSSIPMMLRLTACCDPSFVLFEAGSLWQAVSARWPDTFESHYNFPLKAALGLVNRASSCDLSPLRMPLQFIGNK